MASRQEKSAHVVRDDVEKTIKSSSASSSCSSCVSHEGRESEEESNPEEEENEEHVGETPTTTMTTSLSEQQQHVHQRQARGLDSRSSEKNHMIQNERHQRRRHTTGVTTHVNRQVIDNFLDMSTVGNLLNLSQRDWSIFPRRHSSRSAITRTCSATTDNSLRDLNCPSHHHHSHHQQHTHRGHAMDDFEIGLAHVAASAAGKEERNNHKSNAFTEPKRRSVTFTGFKSSTQNETRQHPQQHQERQDDHNEPAYI